MRFDEHNFREHLEVALIVSIGGRTQANDDGQWQSTTFYEEQRCDSSVSRQSRSTTPRSELLTFKAPL
jgi:hypothetical protein